MQDNLCNWQHRAPYSLHILVFSCFCLDSLCVNELHHTQHNGMCEHRFCSQTKTIGDRNCTAYFSLANIFNQSTNKSFGAKLQSEVTGGFAQVRIGNLINQSATSCAISISPPCSKTVLSKKRSKTWPGERILMLTLKQADVRLEYKARVRFALPYSWPNINWIVP